MEEGKREGREGVPISRRALSRIVWAVRPDQNANIFAAESGLFPGVVYYFSMWYKRRERQFRISLFFSAAALAGSFGGILAYVSSLLLVYYKSQTLTVFPTIGNQLHARNRLDQRLAMDIYSGQLKAFALYRLASIIDR